MTSNTGMDIAAVDREIALAGMFMVLFLTANGIAQAVRERFAEFATLKTIGFSDWGVIGLVFAEAAIPCLLGAGLGVGLAEVLSSIIPRFVPPGQGVPVPTMTVMVLVWAVALRRAGRPGELRLASAAAEADGHRNRAFRTLNHAAPDLRSSPP